MLYVRVNRMTTPRDFPYLLYRTITLCDVRCVRTVILLDFRVIRGSL